MILVSVSCQNTVLAPYCCTAPCRLLHLDNYTAFTSIFLSVSLDPFTSVGNLFVFGSLDILEVGERLAALLLIRC